MTVKYAEELKSRLCCSACSDVAAPKRKFCRQHLEYARQAWHRHAKRCAAERRCINCSKKKLPDEQRCASCKGRNQSSCREWMRVHYRERYLDAKARGVCTSCRRRSPEAGMTRCSHCKKPSHQKRTRP